MGTLKKTHEASLNTVWEEPVVPTVTRVCVHSGQSPHQDRKTHTHTHTFVFVKVGTSHRRNGFYTVQTVCAIALHLPYT